MFGKFQAALAKGGPSADKVREQIEKLTVDTLSQVKSMLDRKGMKLGPLQKLWAGASEEKALQVDGLGAHQKEIEDELFEIYGPVRWETGRTPRSCGPTHSCSTD
jgi:hypothetical protein